MVPFASHAFAVSLRRLVQGFNIIYLTQNSIFPVGNRTYEISVTNTAIPPATPTFFYDPNIIGPNGHPRWVIPTPRLMRPKNFTTAGWFEGGTTPKCHDGSTPKWIWFTPEERPKARFRTYIKACPGQSPPAHARQLPPPYRATVCHPFLRPMAKYPLYSEEVVQQWVEHYLHRGFQHVYFYVHNESEIYRDVSHVTWFVVPWIEGKGLHWGGQITASNHCLYWNKMAGTEWTLFADVDEFLVVTQRYKQARSNLVDAAVQLAGARVAAFDFGEYRIRHNLLPPQAKDFVMRLDFNASNVTTKRQKGNVSAKWQKGGKRGRRKTLARPAYIYANNIHASLANTYPVYHFDNADMALLHARNILNREQRMQFNQRHKPTTQLPKTYVEMTTTSLVEKVKDVNKDRK